MRRLLIGLALMLLPSPLQAADTALSALSSGVAVSASDLFYDVQTVGIGGVKVTGAQVKTFMLSTPTITGPATFNGSVTFSDNGIWAATGIGTTSINATPIGSTTASLGTFTDLTSTRASVSTMTFANLTGGGTQCVQVNNTGVVSGAACNNSVNQVLNSDGTLTISPTTGTVVAGLSLGHANVWTAALTGTAGQFTTLTISGLTPTTNSCLQVNSGLVSTTSQACGGGGGGTPGGATTQVQFNNGGAFAGDPSFTFVTPAQVSLALGTITSNLKAINVTGTWNTSAVTFDAPLFENINTTLAGSSSLLVDLQTNTASRFSITLSGDVVMQNSSKIIGRNPGAGSSGMVIFTGGNNSAFFNGAGGANGFLQTFMDLGWVSGFDAAGGTVDVSLHRQAANTLLQINGTNPQSWRVANTFTSAVNYEMGILDWNTPTTNVFNVGTIANGSGVGRSVAIVASATTALFVSPTGVISLYNQQNPAANETFAVCAATGATLTTGGQLFVDTTACLASSMLVKHNIAAFNDYGMRHLASLAEPLHASSRLADKPIDVDPVAEIMALVPASANYDTLDPNTSQFTLIAQNACEVDEHLCERTRDGDIRSYRPNAVLSLLVAMVQKQQQEIEELKRRLH